jgi:hypothetical protein
MGSQRWSLQSRLESRQRHASKKIDGGVAMLRMANSMLFIRDYPSMIVCTSVSQTVGGGGSLSSSVLPVVFCSLLSVDASLSDLFALRCDRACSSSCRWYSKTWSYSLMFSRRHCCRYSIPSTNFGVNVVPSGLVCVRSVGSICCVTKGVN